MNRFSKMIRQIILNQSFHNDAKYYTVDYYDGRLICPRSFAETAFLGPIWEPESRLYLEQNVKAGNIVIDVGACFGLYTFLFSRLVGKEGLVYAFEPDPTMFSLLRINVGINRLENVILFNSAVSNETGLADFYLSTAGASSLQPQKGMRSVLQVDVIDIDSLGLSSLDWLKIDVEGTEHLVIQGARQTLKKYNTRLLVEFLPQFRNIEPLLMELANYDLLGLDYNVLCRLKERNEN